MEVILLQRIEKLGKMGDIVKVRPGYARNFLLPKKVALRVTKENIARFEHEKEALNNLNLKLKEEADILAKRLEGTMVTIIRQASDSGQLYGSVNTKVIADSLKQEHVTKTHIKINRPIKTIGIHTVYVQLHPEVMIKIGVNVAMSEDEASAQAKTLERITASSEEKNPL